MKDTEKTSPADSATAEKADGKMHKELAIEAVDAMISKYEALKAKIEAGSISYQDIRDAETGTWRLESAIESYAAVITKAEKADPGSVDKMCVCPKCGYEKKDDAGIMCTSLTCSKCGATMERKGVSKDGEAKPEEAKPAAGEATQEEKKDEDFTWPDDMAAKPDPDAPDFGKD